MSGTGETVTSVVLGSYYIDRLFNNCILFLQENNIELKKGVAALKVGPTQKQVHLSNGETINYEKLFIATGSQWVCFTIFLLLV